MFEDFSSFQIWLLIAAAFAAGFYLGRSSSDASSSSRAQTKRLIREEAARGFGQLSTAQQAEVNRLAAAGEIIDAVKYVRMALNTGLYEAKQIIDERRRNIPRS